MNVQPYGWRARIGLILPADNVVMEPELSALGLDGVSFHGLRLTSTEPETMRQQAVELAVALDEMGVDAAVYACAETSFNGGREVRTALSSLIAQRCSVPIITATNAMTIACEALAIRQPTVITPYTAESGAGFVAALRDHGVEPRAALHRDFSLDGDDEREWYFTNRQPASTAYDMARRTFDPQSDGVIIASTNLPTLAVAGRLERDLEVPVVTSNQSILWWCLNSVGISTSDIALGRLMTAPVPVAAGR
jgi:maleate isomerase